jgi:ParB-like chromosome segregation protein Spo0J
MRTEMRPIAEVKRYWRNPRKKQNIDKMAAALVRFGWRQPIVVDKNGTIIVGDTRYLGAMANGYTHVPVWPATDLTEAQVHAYRIADNRLAEESEWDEAFLTAELELLQTLGIERSELEEATAFNEKELAGYLDVEEPDHTLSAMEVNPFPPFTWVLIGIPTERYYEIAEAIEQISGVPDIFAEVSANDQKP